MKVTSIRMRSAILLSAAVTVLWLATAALTARLLTKEMGDVFDSALQETGQRILQLAVVDVLNREEEGVTRRVTGLAEHEEHFTYVVRDAEGRVLLSSHRADPENFPLFAEDGFQDSNGQRFYREAAVRGTVIMTIAEPIAHRRAVAIEMALALALPLLLMVPLSVAVILTGLGVGLRPLDRLRDQLARRGASELSPLPDEGWPAELRPITQTVNDLLIRLDTAFSAERSFAANAAHELRTPLAGALAQVQRLRQQSADAETRRRADEVEATLKRLTRLSEKLMQLARAEGARLVGDAGDIRSVIDLVATELGQGMPARRVQLDVPEAAVMSSVDPDAIAIVARNLIENALRHGTGDEVRVTLDSKGVLSVENGGDAISPDLLASLTGRFVRGGGRGDGSGLGLAIVQTIAGRIGSRLDLESPVPGRAGGFRASIALVV